LRGIILQFSELPQQCKNIVLLEDCTLHASMDFPFIVVRKYDISNMHDSFSD